MKQNVKAGIDTYKSISKLFGKEKYKAENPDYAKYNCEEFANNAIPKFVYLFYKKEANNGQIAVYSEYQNGRLQKGTGQTVLIKALFNNVNKLKKELNK